MTISIFAGTVEVIQRNMGVDTKDIHQLALIEHLSGRRPKIFDASGVPEYLAIRKPEEKIPWDRFRVPVIPMGAKGAFLGGIDKQAASRIETYRRNNFQEYPAVYLGVIALDTKGHTKIVYGMVSIDSLSTSPSQLVKQHESAALWSALHANSANLAHAALTGRFIEKPPGIYSDPITGPIPTEVLSK